MSMVKDLKLVSLEGGTHNTGWTHGGQVSKPCPSSPRAEPQNPLPCPGERSAGRHRVAA